MSVCKSESFLDTLGKQTQPEQFLSVAGFDM